MLLFDLYFVEDQKSICEYAVHGLLTRHTAHDLLCILEKLLGWHSWSLKYTMKITLEEHVTHQRWFPG